VALTLVILPVVPAKVVPVIDNEDTLEVNLPVVPVTAAKVVFPAIVKVSPLTLPVALRLVVLTFVPVKLVIVALGPEKDVVALTVPPVIFVPVTLVEETIGPLIVPTSDVIFPRESILVPDTVSPFTKAVETSVVKRPVVAVTAAKVVFPITTKLAPLNSLVALTFVPVKLVMVAAVPEKDVVALTVAPLIFVPVTLVIVALVIVALGPEKDVVALTVSPLIFVPVKLVIVAAGPEKEVVALTVPPRILVPDTDSEDTSLVNLPEEPSNVPTLLIFLPLILIGPVALNKAELTEVKSTTAVPAVTVTSTFEDKL
jgi:hypothetical protein